METLKEPCQRGRSSPFRFTYSSPWPPKLAKFSSSCRLSTPFAPTPDQSANHRSLFRRAPPVIGLACQFPALHLDTFMASVTEIRSSRRTCYGRAHTTIRAGQHNFATRCSTPQPCSSYTQIDNFALFWLYLLEDDARQDAEYLIPKTSLSSTFGLVPKASRRARVPTLPAADHTMRPLQPALCFLVCSAFW